MGAGTLLRNGDPDYHGLNFYDHHATMTRATTSASDDGRHDDDDTDCDDT